MGDWVPWGAGIRDDQDEDPSGPSEHETDDRAVRERFVQWFESVVEYEDIRELIKITYDGQDGNVLTLGPEGFRGSYRVLRIAVYDHTGSIKLLSENGTPVGKWVPSNTFITFVRYLYMTNCRGELMCETALIDMLQGVIVKYARDRITLHVREVSDSGGVKEIWLWNTIQDPLVKRERLPFVNVIDGYRVKTMTSAGGGWHWLCTTREGAIERGFIVDAGGDECVGEPCSSVHDAEGGVEPQGGFVRQLFTLDRKLAEITTLDRRVLSSCLGAHMAPGKSRRETNLGA